jgi:ribonuclease HI
VILARFDGGCWNNPGGPASAACLIEKDGVEIYRNSKLIEAGPGVTNNVAEFEGLMLILEWLHKSRKRRRKEIINIISDSQVVIRRMHSKTLPHGHCRLIAYQCLKVYSELGLHINFGWQKRGNNRACDEMCTKVLKENSRSAPKIPSYMNDDQGYKYGSEII